MKQLCQATIWSGYRSYVCNKPAKFYFVTGKKITHLCGVHRRSEQRYHEMHELKPDTSSGEHP